MRVHPRSRKRLITGFVAASLLLAACGGSESADDAGSDSASSGSDTSADAGADEGSGQSDLLVVAVPSENTTLASHQSPQEVNSPGLKNIYEGLVTRDPVTNEIVGELATSWEQIEPTRWRFVLREGVKFHDGTDFNADAAAFAINFLFADEEDRLLRSFMGSQTTAEVVDDMTIDVITEEPDPIIPERMYFTGIPSKRLLEEQYDTYETNPIGTGPYMYDEWVRGQYFQIKANPDWWGLTSDDAIGEITFDRVRFVPRPEGGVRTSLIQTGEAQLAMFLSAEQCDTLRAASGTDCVQGPSVETLFIRFDTPNPVLADARVRRAIILATDRATINDSVLGGQITLGSQIVGPASFGFDPDLEPYPFDPDQARALIAEARADGVPVDQPLMINMRQEAIPRIEEVGQAMQQMLRDVGLNVDLQLQEASIYNPEYGEKPTASRNYITVHPVGNDPMDAASSYQSYGTCDRGISGICDPALDALIAEASQAVGEERRALLQQVGGYIHDNALLGFFGQLDLAYGVVEGFEWNVPLDHRLHATRMSLN